MIKIYQGGSPGLIQQSQKTVKKFLSKEKNSIQREIQETLKGIYKFDLVLMQIGSFYNAIEEDAIFINKEFGIKKVQPGNWTFEVASIHKAHINKYIEKLKIMNKTFCILEQKEISPRKFERTVVISTSQEAIGITF